MLSTPEMTDEDDWQAVLHIAVFIRAQAPVQAGYNWMSTVRHRMMRFRNKNERTRSHTQF